MSLLKLPTIEELKQMKEEDKKRKEEEKKREEEEKKRREEAKKQVEKEILDEFNKLLNEKIKYNYSSLLKGNKLIIEIYKSYFSKINNKYTIYDSADHYYNCIKYIINDLNEKSDYEIIMGDIIKPNEMGDIIDLTKMGGIIGSNKVFEKFEITIRLKL